MYSIGMNPEIFVSYAQNFEDLYIYRCFGKLKRGTIVDVGAHDPILDSVSYSFYLRGWKCINIEPLQEKYEKLLSERPNDINLNFAIGTSEKIIKLFNVEYSGGLSTTKSEMLAQHAHKGYLIKEVSVIQVTLQSVLKKHLKIREFEVLKIDVEGAEEEVLKSLDFLTFQPKLVIIEATIPGTQIPNYDQWEHILNAASYKFAHFDGSNRYYLSPTSFNDLIGCFEYPPSAFDSFVRIRGAEDPRVRSEISNYLSKYGFLNVHSRQESELDLVLNSLSWKLTKPLRAIKSLVLRRR
jgi:FkbM family methyltransferase